MTPTEPSPLLLPLAGLLRTRGAKIVLNCELNSFLAKKELCITVPLLAQHRSHLERRIVVGIGNSLESWREKLRWRGINLLSVSAEGLAANADGIADKVCAHIFRVSVEDLREYIQVGMPLVAITAFTGIEPREIARMVPRFYGMTVQELRESQ